MSKRVSGKYTLQKIYTELSPFQCHASHNFIYSVLFHIFVLYSNIQFCLYQNVMLRSKPLLIVHGDQREKKKQLEREAEPFPNVKLFQVEA